MSVPKTPTRTQPPPLNERQRIYLVAAYRLDQQQEQAHKHDYVRGVEPVPAAEWRLIPYGRWKHRQGTPATELRQLIEQQQTPGTRLVDPGAGSTWKALAERGLVEIEERVIVDDPHPRIGYSLPCIRLTRKGRQLVRQLTGEKRASTPRREKPQQPEGLLPQQVWRALILLYQRDAAGIEQDFIPGTYGGIPRNSFDYLQEKDLIDRRPHNGNDIFLINQEGRTYYHRFYRVNVTAYPRASAEVPRPVLSPEHRAFWQLVQELSRQRDFAGLDHARQEACRRELLQLQLAQSGGTLYAAPYWYPMLGGRALTTAQNRSPEDFRCETEAEALALFQQRQRYWQQQLTALL